MEFFPNFKTIVSFGSIQVTWYAIFILTGVILAYMISIRQLKKWGYDSSIFEDFFIYMLPIGIFGARLYYVIFEWQQYVDNPIRIFYIWEGGLAIHGGILAATLFGLWYFHKRALDPLRIMDAIFPNVLIAQAIGRWGNFINQEAFGGIVDASYYDGWPAFIKDHMFIGGAYRQPTFLYESVANIIGFFLITFIYKKYGRKKRGDLAFAYFAWYGMVRFFIEGMRSDALMLGSLKVAQVVSLLGVAFAIVGILGVWNHLFKNKWPFKREKPVVLFDLDGTLVDTKELIYASFQHCFQRYKPDYVLRDEELQSFLGPTLEESFLRYFPEEQVQDIIKAYRLYNLAHHHTMVKEIPGAKDALQYLLDHEYCVGVVSNKVKEDIVLGLQVLGMEDKIDVIVGVEDVDIPKPNPQGILKACEALYHNHDDVIYVGDTSSDIMTCKNMGGYSIAYVYDDTQEGVLKQLKPCKIIHHLQEIVDIVKEENEWSDVTI